MTWTEYEDVEMRWFSGPIPANEEVVETLIADVEDYILGEFPDLQDRIDNEEIPQLRVVKVVCRVVARVLRNPEGHRSLNQGAGPFTQSVTFGGEDPGAIYLTREERKELSSRSRGRAFSVDMTSGRPYLNEEDLWQPIQ